MDVSSISSKPLENCPLPTFLPPFISQRTRKISNINQSPIKKKLENLFARTNKNSKIVGGGIRLNKYNHRYNLIGTDLFISHYRYTNYDDNLQTHKIKTLTINGNDIARLQQGQYLNDTIIDYGIRTTIHKKNQDILPLSTQFYTMLKKKGPLEVRTWHKANIFKRKLILVPIHAMNHWSLCVIFMPPHDINNRIIPPQIQHMDSMKIHDTITIVNNIRHWITSEWKKNYPHTQIPTKYLVHKFPSKKQIVSPQTNGYDCGVYVCHNANITIQHLYETKQKDYVYYPPDYTISQDGINQIRLKLIENIFKGQIRQHTQTTEIAKQKQNPIPEVKLTQEYTNNEQSKTNNSRTGILSKESTPHLANKKSNARLNTTWQQVFSKALRPPVNIKENNTIQFPTRERTALLQPATNEQIGAPMTEVHDNLRIWSVNANTILLRSGLAELHELCIQIKKFNISIICFQEVNIDLLDYKMRKAIEAVFNQYFVNKIYFSTTPIRSPTHWKPGGIMTVTVNEISHSVSSYETDDLGRWCKITLSNNKGSSLTVYNVYNTINNNISTAGPSTIWMQQWKLLRLSGKLQPNPRKQFITDLSSTLEKDYQNKNQICILGDLNEVLGEDPNLMSSICVKYKLHDAFNKIHPNIPAFTTYIRGTKRLDYMLISNSLQPTEVGYNQFYEIYNSDHRAMYIDLPKIQDFTMNQTMVKGTLREIGSKSKDIVKFVETIYEHLHQNKTFHKFELLQLEVSEADKPWRIANIIDDQLGLAITKAKKECFKYQRPPWSEVLHKASLTLRYWIIAESSLLNKIKTNEVLNNIQNTIPDLDKNIQQLSDLPKKRLLQIKVFKQEALKQLRLARKNAVELRKEFLLELRQRIASRKKSEDNDPVKALAIVTAQIRISERFGRIRATKERNNNALTKVTILQDTIHIDPTTSKTVYRNKHTGDITESPTYKTVDIKNELEKVILERNQKHFSKAKNSPWNIPPLKHINKNTNYNLEKNQMGNQICLSQDNTLETITVLNLLKQLTKENKTKWSSDITFDQFIAGLRNWKEQTNTSPSGRHLGVYKALLIAYTDFGNEFTKEYDQEMQIDCQGKSEKILRIMHGLVQMSANNGFYLHRWEKVFNIMIYKTPGCIDLEKLRVLHLFEADMNLMIGILFGRRAMKHITDNKLYHTGQYGRPGGECLDAVYAKNMSYHVSHYTKTSLGTFESDAESCFDRLVMGFVLVCFIALGAPKKAVQSWETVLKHIVHYVQTGHGISEDFYKYTEQSPIIGPGQGSTGGPSSCSTMVFLLLMAMDQLAKGMYSCSPEKSIEYSTKSIMFFDDNTNYNNNFLANLENNQDPEQAVTSLGKDTQHWERLLSSSGGKLKFIKCGYYVILWNFDTEGNATMTPAEQIPNMYLTSGNSSTKTKMRQYDCQQSHVTLGVHITPSLQMKDAQIKLYEIGKNFGLRLLTSALNKYDTWIAYFSVGLPSMTYTLPVMHHTKKSLSKVQTIPVKATLLKLGFNRHTSKKVVFGSQYFMGLGLRHLYVEQGIAQLNILMRHVRSQTDLGKQTEIALQWWQLNAGVSYPLLQFTKNEILYTGNTWFTSIRKFLHTLQGSLHIPSIQKGIPNKLRTNDTFLMDDIANQTMTIKDKERFNRVRLWMRVYRLSEICSADGQQIDQNSWTGNHVQFTNNLWPRQTKPGPKSFRCWRRMLSQMYLLQGKNVSIRTKNLNLKENLGQWTHHSEWIRKKWTMFYSPIKNLLYTKYDDQYKIHTHNRNSRRWTRKQHRAKLFHSQHFDTTTETPNDIIPVDGTYNKENISINSVSSIQPTPIKIKSKTWQEYITNLPLWEQQLLSNIKIHSTEKLIKILKAKEKIYMCSDGGAVKEVGSYGAVIASVTEILLELDGQVYGHTPRSFRSEAYGMLAILLTLFHFKIFHNIKCNIKPYIICDNSGLLHRVSTIPAEPSPRRCLLSEADVELQIVDTIQQLNADPLYMHVKSHPDETIPVKELPWNSQLNVKCDEKASEKLKNLEVKPRVTTLPASKIMLSINNTTITHHQASQIRRAYSKASSKEYLSHHHQWKNQFETIDWETVHATYKKMPFHMKLFVTKWVNKILPLNQRRFKWNLFPTPMCPSWCQQLENEQHLLTCNHQARQSHNTAFSKILTQNMKTLNIDPYLQEIIQTYLERLYKCQNTKNIHYNKIYEKQYAIGKYSIFYGLLTQDWVHQQNKYLYYIGKDTKKNQAQYAIKKIIKLCWDYVYEVWLLRNTHQHDTKEMPMNFKKIQLLQEIKDLYAMKTQMLSADRDIFSKDIKEREHHTIMQLQEYKKFAKQITQQSVADAKEHGKNFRKIDQYFTSQKKKGEQGKNHKTEKKTTTWTRNTSRQDSIIKPPKIIPPPPRVPKPG